VSGEQEARNALIAETLRPGHWVSLANIADRASLTKKITPAFIRQPLQNLVDAGVVSIDSSSKLYPRYRYNGIIVFLPNGTRAVVTNWDGHRVERDSFEKALRDGLIVLDVIPTP
jgi:hypothetical protein